MAEEEPILPIKMPFRGTLTEIEAAVVEAREGLNALEAGVRRTREIWKSLEIGRCEPVSNSFEVCKVDEQTIEIRAKARQPL